QSTTTPLDAGTTLDLKKPATLEKLQSVLPRGIRVLAYSVTSQGTYVFIITRDDFKWVKSPVNGDVLNEMVHDYVSAVSHQSPIDEITETGKQLYKYLIEPAKNYLNDKDLVYVLPDKALHFLPFPALIDPSGQFLIESYRLSYAPSASALVRCILENRNRKANAEEKILTIGNPAFAREDFPNLQDLPNAQQEAIASAGFYGNNKVVLKGPEATKDRVKTELAGCDVAHLALHCLVEE